MVTKKASKDNVKKVSEPVAAKKTAAKATAKPAAKKAAPAKAVEVKKAAPAAKAPAKKAAAKKVAPSAGNTPVTADKDVINDVLAVKAKNETKKAVKAKSAAVRNNTASEAAEKGAKAVSAKSKRDAVKENAHKAEAKKFMALKEEASTECCCSVSCCFCGAKDMFAAWLDAYKKIFDYKSRTTRCDFWAFVLINFIFMLLVTIPYEYANYNALFSGTEVSPVTRFAYLGFLIVELLAYLALYVRRLHDTGASSWKGFFAPLTYSALGIVALAAIGNFALSDETIGSEKYETVSSVLGLGVLVLLLINLYYLIKTFIAVGFIEEERAENAYGAPKFTDDCGKGKILRYATWYTLLTIIYVIIVLSVQFSLYLALIGRGF